MQGADIDTERDEVFYEGYGSRPRSLRAHWVNCCQRPDAQVIAVDRMEDELTAEERRRAQPIRRLISRFEVCHWNSDRWLERVVQAIAEERVPPTSGRPRAQHPLALMLRCTRELLAHWVTRSTAEVPRCTLLDRSSVEVYDLLGVWTPFKAWVVQRILDGLEHHMCAAGLLELPEGSRTRFYPGELTLDSSEADAFFAESLDMLAEARSRRLAVRREIDGQVEEHSLALVVGYLNPCNRFYFEFLFALFEYLNAPDEDRILPSPFCGNISPARHVRYFEVVNALRRYLAAPPESSLPADERVLAQLGDSSAVKRWLAASLDVTLRAQMPPPPRLGQE
jgi:hypothetical protein